MPARSKPAVRRPAAARTSSRTSAAKRPAKAPVERRQTARLDVLWQLNVEILSQPMPVSAREISATGFSVETTTPFDDGSVHEFRFTLDGGPSAVLTAESAHSQPTERVGELQLYTTGFKFVELTTDDKAALKTLLATIQEYLALA
jgi:hypothetical protein